MRIHDVVNQGFLRVDGFSSIGGGASAISTMSSNRVIGSKEVVAKLKDDGDFDRLRLQITRKLKDNEDLRSSIVSMVKQSSLLNQPGAENMKPRQLSDAIYEEVGDGVRSKISDGLWEIIGSRDGMKSEITGMVESVYRKLVNPNGKEHGSPSHQQEMTVKKENDNNKPNAVVLKVADDPLPDNEPNEPPGFSLNDHHHNDDHTEQDNGNFIPNDTELTLLPKAGPFCSETGSKQDKGDDAGVPGKSAAMEEKQPCGASDDDPDLPPGFV